jgi:hypothetical protein
MKRANVLRCCFCGLVPDARDYVQVDLSVPGSTSFQLFGAHRQHLQDRMLSGFVIELPEGGQFEDD